MKKGLPAKFANEMTCPFCVCTFIPRLDGQTYCESCTQHGLKVEDKVAQTREILYTNDPNARASGKILDSKPCKLCNTPFIPMSPATQYCNSCREQRAKDKLETVGIQCDVKVQETK